METKILFSVDIKAEEALKKLAETKIKVDELKAAQKKQEKTTLEGRVAFEKLGQEIKTLNDSAKAQQKTIEQDLKLQQKKEGSLNSLKIELAKYTAQYNELSAAERSAAKGVELQTKIKGLSDELKNAEQAIGNNTRSVGNYEIAGKSLKAELRELTEQLTQMTLQGAENSDEFKMLAKRAGELKDARGDIDILTKGFANDTRVIDGFVEAMQTATAVFGIYSAAVGLSADNQKEYEEQLKKMQVVVTALISLSQIQNTLQEQSNLYQLSANLLTKVGIVQTVAQTKAEAALSVVKGKGSLASKIAAAATWLWNKALAANPAVLLLGAVAALTAGVLFLAKAFSKSAQAAKEAEKAQKALEDQQTKTAQSIEKTAAEAEGASEKINLASKRELLELEKSGATKEQIRAAEAASAQKLRDIELQAIRDRVKAKTDEQNALAQVFKKEQKLLTLQKEGTEKYIETQKRIAEIETKGVVLRQELAIASAQLAAIQVDAEREKLAAAKEGSKEQVDLTNKLLELTLQLNVQKIKAEKDFQKEDFFSKQNYEARLFSLQQDFDKKKIEAAKRSNEITAKEATLQLDTLLQKQVEFNNAQEAASLQEVKSRRDAIQAIFKETAESQIKELQERYKKALADFAIPESSPDYENFLLEKAALEIRLQKQLNDEIAAIRAADIDKRATEIETAVNKQYSNDLKLFSDNEREKARLEIQKLRETSERKKAAGLNDIDEQVAIRQQELQLLTLQLNTELLLAGDNYNQKYELRKLYLEKESLLFKDNYDRQVEINADLLENEKVLLENRTKSFEAFSNKITEYKNVVSQILGEISNLLGAQFDSEILQINEKEKSEKESLQRKLDNRLISQETYDAISKKNEEKAAKERGKIQLEEAKRQRALRLFQIAIDTAVAITASIAASPLTFGLPWAAANAATGALQTAAVLAAPLPKYKRGGKITGASHEGGGVLAELEGGEVVINKRSAAMFSSQLSAINQAGGGVPLFRDGGYAVRNSRQLGISAEQVAEAVARSLENIQIYTAVSDIRRVDANYTEIVERGTF